jgi:hypothetical protein
MKMRLSDFGTDSWVISSQRRPEYSFLAKKMESSESSPIKSDRGMPQIADSCEGWYCSSYFWTFIHVNGELVSITVECDSWDYENLCGGGGGVPDPFVGGGGEPGGGYSDYNPCDPIGPPMQIPPFECLDACNWMDPTSEWYCGEPCSTGNSVIDDLQTQQGFTELWQASNTDLPIGQRREQGGWIVSTSNGNEVEQWSGWATFPCGIAMPEDWYESAPSNTVGIVHTHPFFAGDDTTAPAVCGEDETENWTSGFSTDDYMALAELASYLSNAQLVGYVIDGNNILTYNVTSFDLQPESADNRCGY